MGNHAGQFDGSGSFLDCRVFLRSEENETDDAACLDMWLWSVAVCVIDAIDKHIFERAVACEIVDILACVRDVPAGQCWIGSEFGAMRQHLYY